MIVGRVSRSSIGTLVDRTSRLLKLVHVPAGHMAVAFAAALTTVADTIPTAARRTLTWDQGSEMARHDLLVKHFPEGVYFARPSSPWLRGTNENTVSAPPVLPERHRSVRAQRGRTLPGRGPADQPPTPNRAVADAGRSVRNPTGIIGID